MAVEKRAHEQLTRWIQHEKKLVNYREIAREFRLNINTAKRILAEHHTANPSLFPTYLLTGQYLPSISTYTDTPPSTNEDPMDVDEEDEKPAPKNGTRGTGYPLRDDIEVVRSGMALVGGKEEMEAKLPLFTPATLHVQLYSLSPSRVKDPAQYLWPLLRLRKYPNYCDAEMYGTTRGSFELLKVEGRGESSKSIPSAYVKPSGAIASSSKAKPVVKEKPKPKQDEEEELKPKYKKKVIASDDEEDEPDAGSSSNAVAKATQPLKKMDSADADRIAMEAMMDMSDDFKPSSPMRAGSAERRESADAGPSTTAKTTSEKAPAVKNKKKRNSEAAGNAGSSGDEGAPKAAGGRVRKRRRTVKQVATTDAKGYMVFEDVSGEESYSSDGTEDVKPNLKKPAKGKKSVVSASASGSRAGSEDKDVKPNLKPSAVSTKAGGKAPAVKKPGQQSLSSFFKKK